MHHSKLITVASFLESFTSKFKKELINHIGELPRTKHTMYQESQIYNYTNRTLYVRDASNNEYEIEPAYDDLEDYSIVIERRVDLRDRNPKSFDCVPWEGQIEVLRLDFSTIENKPIYVPQLNVIIYTDEQRSVIGHHPWQKILNMSPKTQIDPRKMLDRLQSSFAGFVVVATGQRDIGDYVYMELGGRICQIDVLKRIDDKELPNITVYWKTGDSMIHYDVVRYELSDIKKAMGGPLPFEGHAIPIATDKKKLEKFIENRDGIEYRQQPTIPNGAYTSEDIDMLVEERKEEYEEKEAQYQRQIEDLKEKLKLEKDAVITARKTEQSKLQEKDIELRKLKSDLANAHNTISRYEGALQADIKLKQFDNDRSELGFKEKKLGADERKLETEERRDAKKYEYEDKKMEKDIEKISKEEASNEKVREHKEKIASSQVKKETVAAAASGVKAATVLVPAAIGLGAVVAGKFYMAKTGSEILGFGIGGILSETVRSIAGSIVSAVTTPISAAVSCVSDGISSAGQGFTEWFRCNVWF